MISWDREDRRRVMRIRFVELGIVVIVGTGEINDVANVVAELWTIFRQRPDHLIRHVRLKLRVLYSTGIAEDIADHRTLANLSHDLREVFAEIVAIRREPQGPGQLLISRVTVGQRIKGAHAAMRLRAA